MLMASPAGSAGDTAYAVIAPPLADGTFGVIETPRNRSDAKSLDPEVPLGRSGSPEEVAALVSWLVSDEAAYATGASYVLDGGMTQQVVARPAGESK